MIANNQRRSQWHRRIMTQRCSTSYVVLLFALVLCFNCSTLASVTLDTSSPLAASVWQWEKLVFDVEGPSARVFAASSGGSPVPPPYAPADTSGIVFFGGTSDPSNFYPVFNDIWILNPQDNHNDGRAWTNLPINPKLQPPPRCLSAVAVGEEGVMFMYGGYNGTHWFEDFWSIDLTPVHFLGQVAVWTYISAEQVNPPGMAGMTMSWIGKILVMFGGGDGRLLYSNVWEYTAASEYPFSGWQLVSGSGSDWPEPREFQSALLHPADGEIYVFGGYTYGYSYFNDTWYYALYDDYGAFTPVRLEGSAPAQRALFASAYSPKFNQTLMYGGKDTDGLFSDAWLFDTRFSTWTLVDVTTSGDAPGALYGMSSGYFVQGSGMVFFGGADAEGNVYNDTWLLAFPY